MTSTTQQARDAILGALRNPAYAQEIQDAVAPLVLGWLEKFGTADLALTIQEPERELAVWLDPQTLLLGRIDLTALDGNGEPFIGEWKTASSKKRNRWKQEWEMSVQSLTYGVITRADRLNNGGPPPAKFTVRVAFKPTVPGARPTYDFQWFRFSQAELDFWQGRILGIAQEIRDLRNEHLVWFPNFSHCHRYGPKYPCPFFENNCSRLRFENTEGFIPRVSHLELERGLNTNPSELVVLDATRMDDYLNCREKYRQGYEQGGKGMILDQPDNIELQKGSLFHACMKAYYGYLKEVQDVGTGKQD